MFFFQFEAINRAGCELACKTVEGTDAFVAGSISQTPSYQSCEGKLVVQNEVRKQADFLLKYGCEFIIAEVRDHLRLLTIDYPYKQYLHIVW